MKKILQRIDAKKKLYDELQPFSPVLEENLWQRLRVELTYTSNAIEGNTLTRQQTAQLIEKWTTVEWKLLNELLEVRNHDRALIHIQDLALQRQHQDVSQKDILDIHRYILEWIDDLHAGTYRSVAVRIAGSRSVLPNPQKVPDLMDRLESYLQTTQDHPCEIAMKAHYDLVTIPPVRRWKWSYRKITLQPYITYVWISFVVHWSARKRCLFIISGTIADLRK